VGGGFVRSEALSLIASGKRGKKQKGTNLEKKKNKKTETAGNKEKKGVKDINPMGLKIGKRGREGKIPVQNYAKRR